MKQNIINAYSFQTLEEGSFELPNSTTTWSRIQSVSFLKRIKSAYNKKIHMPHTKLHSSVKRCVVNSSQPMEAWKTGIAIKGLHNFTKGVFG